MENTLINRGFYYVSTAIAQPLVLDWQPMPDITTFELAQAMPILINRGPVMPDQFDAYPESVKRHFKVL